VTTTKPNDLKMQMRMRNELRWMVWLVVAGLLVGGWSFPVAADEPEQIIRAEAVPVPARADDQPIRVRSTGGLKVYPEENKMIYMENVRFDHPGQRMIMECDTLEVIRSEPEEKKPAEDGEGAGEDAGENNGEQAPVAVGNQIKWAIATGNVIIQRTDEEGNKSIGQGERAEFDVESGELVLSGAPLLKVGDEIFRGAGPDAKIILRSDGGHHSEGPVETISAQGDAVFPGRNNDNDSPNDDGLVPPTPVPPGQ